jgi:alpha-beta hydrolase superfamily lysophospholipase
MTADLRDFIAATRAAYPGVPVHALGESMGGGVLMAAWAETPFAADSVILVAPAVWGRATMPGYQTAALWISAHTTPWLKVTGEGIKRHPSDNIEMLRALGRDPLVIKATRVDAIWGITNLMDAALAGAEAFDAPSLILYGANDDIIPPNATLDMLAERHHSAKRDAGHAGRPAAAAQLAQGGDLQCRLSHAAARPKSRDRLAGHIGVARRPLCQPALGRRYRRPADRPGEPVVRA